MRTAGCLHIKPARHLTERFRRDPVAARGVAKASEEENSGGSARARSPSRTMLLILFLIGVFSVLGPEGQSPSATLRPPVTEDSGQCSAACESRQQSKLLRLHSIRSQILSALRLERAPNLTRDAARQLVPRAPPLLELLSRYERQNGSTGGDYEEAEEREEASTETIITMATERKRAH